jgi:hypothetical protein
MTGIPDRTEAASYYFTYIDRVASSDIRSVLDNQLEAAVARLRSISEEKSLHRYAPGKWSIRQVLNHINDTERAFLFRAMWFARGFTAPLPGYDQDIAVAGASADSFSWASHLDEFQAIRRDTLAFFRNLPEAAWMRTGIASDNPFTVRALAFIIAGHVSHHLSIVEERYLSQNQ